MADGKITILDETDKTSIENKITTHTSNKSNPHGVTLSQLGVNATATELNYVDGVTSAIQTQLNNKVATSRKVNGKALSADITLSASDVGAATSGHGHTNYALLTGANEFDGEQKFSNAEYCNELDDTANGVGCAIKSTRGLFNELLVDNIFMTTSTKQVPIYTYSSTANGSMANIVKVAYIDASGNAVFNGAVSASNIKDTVIEQGVAGRLSYQKWSSGKSEAWFYEYLGDVPLTSSDAGGVWTGAQYKERAVDIAGGIFSATPLAFGNVCSNGYTLCQVCSTSTSRFVYRIWAPYSCTVTGCYASVYLVGAWK